MEDNLSQNLKKIQALLGEGGFVTLTYERGEWIAFYDKEPQGSYYDLQGDTVFTAAAPDEAVAGLLNLIPK